MVRLHSFLHNPPLTFYQMYVTWSAKYCKRILSSALQSPRYLPTRGSHLHHCPFLEGPPPPALRLSSRNQFKLNPPLQPPSHPRLRNLHFARHHQRLTSLLQLRRTIFVMNSYLKIRKYIVTRVSLPYVRQPRVKGRSNHVPRQ